MTSLTPQPGIKAAVSAVPILSSAVLIQPIRIASHRAGYRRMLNYGRHNAAASAARRRAANGKIIGLCSAGRKNDLVGVATEKSRDLTPRFCFPLQMLGSVAADRGDLTFNPPSVGSLGDSQIVQSLQIQPGLRVTAEVARKAHGRVRRDTTALAHDVVDARSGHVQCFRKRVRAQARRAEEVLTQHLTRMNRAHPVLETHSSHASTQ